jgi:serine/threonine protein kinase
VKVARAATAKLDLVSEYRTMCRVRGGINVVRPLGGGLQPIPHILMEYVEGFDLAWLLRRRRKLSTAEALSVGMDLARALVYVERAALVHCDVKPANIMIGIDGRARLLDFGAACAPGARANSVGMKLTMAYAAPELWQGYATSGTDLYALGALLFECLTGEPPFVGDPDAMMRCHAEACPDMSRIPLGTPTTLRDFIADCLSKDPARRPISAARALAQLAAMAGASVGIESLGRKLRIWPAMPVRNACCSTQSLTVDALPSEEVA